MSGSSHLLPRLAMPRLAMPRLATAVLGRLVRSIGLGSALVAAVVGAGCSSSDDRPPESTWTAEWEQRQQLIPDAEALLDGGREYCDELDGELRVVLRELLPSPSETLDDPVDEWISHAVSIVFECSQDEATIADQLETLEVLAAEVDGGLEIIDR